MKDDKLACTKNTIAKPMVVYNDKLSVQDLKNKNKKLQNIKSNLKTPARRAGDIKHITCRQKNTTRPPEADNVPWLKAIAAFKQTNAKYVCVFFSKIPNMWVTLSSKSFSYNILSNIFKVTYFELCT